MNNSNLLRAGGILFLIAAAMFAVSGITGDGLNIPLVAGFFVIGLALTVVSRRIYKVE